MKNLRHTLLNQWLFLFFLLLLLTACNNEEQQENKNSVNKKTDENIIVSSGIGEFKIGDEPPKYSIKLKKIIHQGEGDDWVSEVIIVSDLQGNKLLTLNKNETNKFIQEIMTDSPRFRTAENIGVNSTIEQFAREYPDYKIWFTYISGRFIMETQKYKNVQFLLNPKDCLTNFEIISDGIPLKINDFRKNSKITNVRVFSLYHNN